MSKVRCDKVVERKFDSYCKIVLKNKMRDYHRTERIRREHEMSLELLCVDSRFDEIGYEEIFCIKAVEFEGDVFEISNDELHDALLLLSEDKSKIIMLYYFGGMTDKEISEVIKLKRTTVRNRCYSALITLRDNLSGGNDGTR